MYAQISFDSKYSFTKNEKDIVKKVKELVNIGYIDNYELYKYGLYISSIAGEILNIDYKELIKKEKTIPIKSRKDIKITIESIVKINNNRYNNVNEIYENIEKNILNGTIKNKNKEIIKFLRK